MEKRVLLAVFLSFLVLFVYQLLAPTPPRPRTATQSGPPPSNPVPPAAGQPVETQPPKPADTGAGATEPAPAPLVAGQEERDIVFDSEAVRAVFTNRGGVLKSWRLKRYLDEGGQPLELLPVDLGPDRERPFSLDVGDQAVARRLAAALFAATEDGLDATRDADRATLTFEYHDEAGLHVRKEFAFRPKAEPYVVRFTASVDQAGRALNPRVLWGPAIGSGAKATGSSYYTPPRAVLFAEGKVVRLAAGKIAEQPAREGALVFAGVEDHYFLAARVGEGSGVKVAYEPITIDAPVEQGGPRQLVSYSVQFAAPPAGETFFVGPKDFDILQAVHRDLVRAIDFGMFAWLVVPLLRALKWVNGYVGNYGWAIIVLTVLINAAMFPLRHKSVVSMRKMQEIQPEVKAIQERYAKLKATDPAKQKMNQELMALYRERGVNPASGCLPMLLTLPVLFAFYALLSVAIELRGAPFVLWIHDLSRHDPLYVTPILMGITMVVQQRMTPMSGDPMQQKMMMFMPIVFTGMFLWAPSGLVIYWFVSNVWGIGQQYLTNRLIGPPKVRTLRPAAERRLKRAGAGQSEQAARNGAAKEEAR